MKRDFFKFYFINVASRRSTLAVESAGRSISCEIEGDIVALQQIQQRLCEYKFLKFDSAIAVAIYNAKKGLEMEIGTAKVGLAPGTINSQF